MKKVMDADKSFDILNAVLLFIVTVVVFYPLYFIVIASVSDPNYVNVGQVVFYPKGFTLIGYKYILKDPRIFQGYANTIFYTVAGTMLNVVLTVLAGYALSRKLRGQKIIMSYFLFTMFFNGGLIPLYILVNNLNLYNTYAVLILLNAVNVYNVIIARTFFQSTISTELFDAARTDGCNNLQFFMKIVLPISKSIIAVLVVFYGVYHWNEYFNSLVFLSEQEKYPIQLVLQQILIMGQELDVGEFDTNYEELLKLADLIKYGLIIVASIPILIVYPFAQKYFVKGIMIGSVKG